MDFNRSEGVLAFFIASLAICGALSLYLAYSLLNDAGFGGYLVPIALIVGAVNAIGAGYCAVRLFPAVRRETREFGQLAEKSESFRTAALTDSLTGLQNRRYFDDALVEYMREFGSIGRLIGIIIIDLDYFKKVNDTYGHDNGDIVLRAVSLCLQQQTRHHDILARLGGEEFAIVFPNVDEASLLRMAERVREAIEGIHLVLAGERVKVTASIGASLWDGKEDGASLIKRADKYLYVAKSSGRNRVCASPEVSPKPVTAKERRVIFGSTNHRAG